MTMDIPNDAGLALHKIGSVRSADLDRFVASPDARSQLVGSKWSVSDTLFHLRHRILKPCHLRVYADIHRPRSDYQSYGFLSRVVKRYRMEELAHAVNAVLGRKGS
jgi:hypothetical protein